MANLGIDAALAGKLPTPSQAEVWRERRRARKAVANLGGPYPLNAPVHAPWLHESDGMSETLFGMQEDMIAEYLRPNPLLVDVLSLGR